MGNKMTYHFYGWKAAKDLRAAGADRAAYPEIRTPLDLYDALSDIWCRDTCAPRMRERWSQDNRTLGQCSVTAFLAQDIFGGEVYGLITGSGDLHCYNVVNGVVFDLTSEQFGEDAANLVYDRERLQHRESPAHFLKSEKRARYEYLRRELCSARKTQK